ncbi:MAG: cyclase family protein [Capsulimonadaceae bacterium]|nr:cyclase family protein [Capsulimonadaceae bacterium]
MSLIDISLDITDKLPTWENHEPGPKVEWLIKFSKNTDCCVSKVQYGSHLGTHLDAPLHFVEGGETVDRIAPDLLVGPVFVAEIPDLEGTEIPASLLARLNIPAHTVRLLLRTSNTRKELLSDPAFHPEFAALAPDAARWLIEQGIQLVGIDYLSIGSAVTGNGGEVHRILLSAGVVVVEGLDLTDAPAGDYTLICLPLKVVGVEGAPVRALLATPGHFA